MSGPLTRVLTAFEGGATTLDEIAATSGVPIEIVRASVEHLVRTGRLVAKELTIGCPSGGCGNCASGTLDGRPGCGVEAPSTTRSGPALVTLQLPRPRAAAS